VSVLSHFMAGLSMTHVTRIVGQCGTGPWIGFPLHHVPIPTLCPLQHKFSVPAFPSFYLIAPELGFQLQVCVARPCHSRKPRCATCALSDQCIVLAFAKYNWRGPDALIREMPEWARGLAREWKLLGDRSRIVRLTYEKFETEVLNSTGVCDNVRVCRTTLDSATSTPWIRQQGLPRSGVGGHVHDGERVRGVPGGPVQLLPLRQRRHGSGPRRHCRLQQPRVAA
jgi:hypothetical protein